MQIWPSVSILVLHNPGTQAGVGSLGGGGGQVALSVLQTTWPLSQLFSSALVSRTQP